MRLAIPALGEKVASESTHAEGVWILNVHEGKVTRREFIGCHVADAFDLIRILQIYQAEVLLCGHLTIEEEEAVRSLDVLVLHSMVCPIEEAIKSLQAPIQAGAMCMAGG